MIFHDINVSDDDEIFAQYDCSLTEAIVARNNQHDIASLAAHWIRIPQSKDSDDMARIEWIHQTLYDNVELGLQVIFVYGIRPVLFANEFISGLYNFNQQH